MEESEKKEYESLYKELEKRRKYILSKFDNQDISDTDYFYYGISYDVINNAYNIVVSNLLGYKSSIGIDISARTIIEALIILDINQKGKINETMKKIYRLSYAAVEQDNEAKVIQRNILSKRSQAQREEDYALLVDLASTYFGLSKKELMDTYSISDPYLFLVKDADDKTNFLSIVKKYEVDINTFIEPYSFFSKMIHPKFLSQSQEDEVFKKRDEYLNSIFRYVKEFMDTTDALVKDIQVSDFAWRLRTLSKESFKEQEKVMNTFIRFNKLLPRNLLPYFHYYIHILEPLIIDINFSYYLRLYDLVVPKFKAFIEMTSVFLHFYHLHDSKDINYQNDALILQSEFRFASYLSDINIKEQEKELEELFFNYYNKRYSVNGVPGFKSCLENEPLYFIKDKNYSFHSLVRSENSKKYLIDEGSIEISTLYEVSLDMCHASGFTFNQSEEVLSYFATLSLSVTYSYLGMITTFFESLIKEVDSSFKGFKAESDFLTKCAKKYDTLANKMLKK